MRITLFAFNTDGDAARRSLACFNLAQTLSGSGCNCRMSISLLFADRPDIALADRLAQRSAVFLHDFRDGCEEH
jgi:hypothetical protein